MNLTIPKSLDCIPFMAGCQGSGSRDFECQFHTPRRIREIKGRLC